MENLPKRNDAIYKEIESFEEYELTQCVVYEMAARNKNNLKSIDDVVQFYKQNKKYIDLNEELIIEDHKKYNDVLRYKSEIENMITDIELFQSVSYFLIEHKAYDRFGVELNQILKLLYFENFQDFSKHHDNNQLLHSDLMDCYTIHKTDVMKDYIIETEINIDDDSECFYDEEIGGARSIETKEDLGKHIISKDIDSLHTISIIRENFKRPELKFDKLMSIKTTIEIDVTKPLNEIIAYVSHIKNDLEKNQNILKAPIELLGEEIQKADNLVCDTKGKCFDSRTILSKQQRLADMFYIYDALKVGITQRKIQAEVYNYYVDAGIETVTMDYKTLKKYKELAIEYIDNFRYRELVTGIKI